MSNSDLLGMSLNSLATSNTYAASSAASNVASRTASNASSRMSVEEVIGMGYTVADSDDAFGLDFTDFLQLMVQQLQNQTIDNAADTSDMLNQMVQMSVVQMMSKVQTSLDELTFANSMSYAASLVGKTVTVGVYNEEGKIEEVVGEVEGTGTYQGTMVIFIDGEMYSLNSIMAVGTLPEVPDTGEGGETEGGDGSETETPETPETPET